MAKGSRAQDGDTNVAKNGYHYTRRDGKWRLTHHLIAEDKLGRPLDTSQERVYFVDKDRTNLDPDNVEVRQKVGGKGQRAQWLRDRIAEYTEELEALGG